MVRESVEREKERKEEFVGISEVIIITVNIILLLVILLMFWPPTGAGFPEGFTGRYFEFQDFERKFEECISKTAVITKFDQHTRRGKTIVRCVCVCVVWLFTCAVK